MPLLSDVAWNSKEPNYREFAANKTIKLLKYCKKSSFGLDGYNYYGNETLYSGINGKEMDVSIFVGIVYYQRLRHMVSDKFQVSSNFIRRFISC